MNSDVNRNNQILENHLSVIMQPFVILSILVLLFNDHFLKNYYPSWLTGKISDFAGLFFFPILLTAILKILFKRLYCKEQFFTHLSFGFTAIWFFAIKTNPLFSYFTESFLSSLLFQNVRIICDPTDLIALIMLIPAWKLQTQLPVFSNQQIRMKNKKVSYIVLVLGIFASLASSPGPRTSIRSFIFYENIVYADISIEYSYQEGIESIPYSTDGGKTWLEINVEDLPEIVGKVLGKYSRLPKTVCTQSNPDICYRTDYEKILVSFDNGETWQVSWEIPPGRKKYMQRTYSPLFNENRDLTLGPYDLLAVNINDEQIVLAAAGEHGILIKIGDSEWERRGLFGATPIPYQAINIEDSFSHVQKEVINNFVTTWLLLFLYMLIHLKTYKSASFLIITFTSLIVLFFFFNGYISMLTLYYPISFFTLVVISTMYTVTSAINTISTNYIVIVTPWIICAFSSYLFTQWALGVIRMYETALSITVFLYGLYILWLLYRIGMRLYNRFLQPQSS